MKRLILAVVAILALSLQPLNVFGDTDVFFELPGRIAYISDDYNVHSLSLHQDALMILTDDATDNRRYLWPTWSNDGRLAYFCCDGLHSNLPLTEVYVSADGRQPGEMIYEGMGEMFNYAAWSPNNCAVGDGCRDLGLLLSQVTTGGGFSVELIRSSDEPISARRVGLGAPFYFSWSPDGGRLLLQRNNRQIDLYDVDEEVLQAIESSPGRFQAPAWSPVDDRLLFGVLNQDGKTDLVIYALSDIRVLQSDLDGAVSFSWSPDGNAIAYRTVSDEQLGNLFVIDAETGEVIAQTSEDGVIAFFWSPDSRRVGFVTLSTPRGSFNVGGSMQPARLSAQQIDGLAWVALDVETEQIRRYGVFIPTNEMIYLLSFFDQFNQSHRVWSPDSSHVVFSEVTASGDSVISILDMTRADAVPFSIADGLIGIWSFR